MDIDLEPFCWAPDKECRFDIKAPFVIAGFRYATDGAIAVRTEAKLPGNIRE